MVKIAFEGISGAGKTTCLGEITQNYNLNITCFPEINPKRAVLDSPSINWLSYHNLWKDRIKILNKLQNNQHLLFDRTYFTTLAFSYATDNQSEYLIQEQKIKEDFSNHYFDLMFIFMCQPALGLNRRLKNNDLPPFPWQEMNFLKRLNVFYDKILPNIYQNRLVFIDSSKSLKEILNDVSNLIQKYIPQKNNSYLTYDEKKNTNIKKIILDFAKKEMLGKPYTNLINVLGYPTIYFRQYAVQYDQFPIYMDNDRLDYIINYTATQ